MCAKVVDNSSSIFSNLPNHLILSILIGLNVPGYVELFEEIEDEFGGDLEEEGVNTDQYNISYIFKDGMIRWDTYLLENDDIFRDNDYVCENLKDEYKNEPIPTCLRPFNKLYKEYYKLIADKYGGEEEYDEWCDNYF